MRRTEGKYIRELKPSLNMIIAGRTKQEYYKDNRDRLLQQQKEYAEKNKEHIVIRQKQYYNDNKEHVAIIKKRYYNTNKEHIAIIRKQHYNENKEHVVIRHKQYYNDNKDKILSHSTEQVECECGCIVSRINLLRHKRSKRHEHLLQTTA